MLLFFFFFSLSIFRGHSKREPASSRVTYFILWAYTGTGVSHSQHRKKIGRGFGKNAGERTGRVEIRKEFLAVSVACMAIYWPTPGLKGRTFKLCVLTRWDFNFCVRSSPMERSGLPVSPNWWLKTRNTDFFVSHLVAEPCFRNCYYVVVFSMSQSKLSVLFSKLLTLTWITDSSFV